MKNSLSLPDYISLSRACLALPCAIFVFNEQWIAAAIVFTLAVISDLIDGYLARKLSVTSRRGSILDHSSDAFFVVCCFFALAWMGYITWWLPVLVAAAFLQYTMDSRIFTGGWLIGNWLGRYNGIFYFLLCGYPIYQQALEIRIFSDRLIELFGWLLLLSTLASMIHRGWLQRRHPAA